MHVSCKISVVAENRSTFDSYPLVVTPSLVVTRGLVHFGKSENLVTKGIPHRSARLLQLRPVWPDTANTRKLGFASHRIDREIREVPWATLVRDYRSRGGKGGDPQTRMSRSVMTETGWEIAASWKILVAARHFSHLVV